MQITQVIVTFVMVIVLILVMPVTQEVEIQLLSIFGLIMSGVVGLSSTSIVSNALSGLSIKFNKPFDIGEMVDIGEHTGRIVEFGLLDTEIQTPEGKLVSIPNSILVNQPIAVIPQERVLILVDVPLEYESFDLVENALMDAANDISLVDPLVRIEKLHNDFINYQVGGFLEDDDRIISKQSSLKKAVLKNLKLHKLKFFQSKNISMVQADKAENLSKIEEVQLEVQNLDEKVFSKAGIAEEIEKLKKLISEFKNQLNDLSPEEQVSLQKKIEENAQKIEELKEMIKEE